MRYIVEPLGGEILMHHNNNHTQFQDFWVGEFQGPHSSVWNPAPIVCW